MSYVSREIHTRQCCCTVFLELTVVIVTVPAAESQHLTLRFHFMGKFSYIIFRKGNKVVKYYNCLLNYYFTQSRTEGLNYKDRSRNLNTPAYNL